MARASKDEKMDIVSPNGLENYERKEKLGEGTYGVVYKAIDLVNNRTVALKKIRTDMDDEGVPSTSIREISALRELKHPNVVQLFDILTHENELYLVMEYMDQDLRRYIEHVTAPTLEPLLVKSYTYQMLQGIQFCHARRILHRDLKPQNLLIDKRGMLKLADFGLARAFCVPMRPYTHEVVTLWYRAPEVLLGGTAYSTGIDTWSAGVIFAEMLTKKALFPGDSEIDEIFKVFKILGKPTNETGPSLVLLPDFNQQWPAWEPHDLADHFRSIGFNIDSLALDLLAQFLIYEPCQRISAKQALKHPYFSDPEFVQLMRQ